MSNTPEADRLAALSDAELIQEQADLEDLYTPEHLLHRADRELLSDAAGVLAGLDDVQLLGAGWVLLGALCGVFAVLFARQGVKMMRGEADPPRLGRHYG